MILEIKDIKVGQRARDEFGDMESLVNSIREYGLLHPIVVDSDYNLIAGCRRLLACEQIGQTEIEAKVLEDVSEKELRILELEENIRRKDLTELEKSKNLVELAEIREQELKRKEYFSESEKKSRGQPKKLSGLKQIAEDMGVPITTLHDAKQHVKAVEEFPPLENFPKYQAIETAKELRKAPPEAQGKIIDFAQRKAQTVSAQTEDNPYAYMEECARLSQSYNKAMYAFLRINADEKEFKMLCDVFAGLPGKLTVESYLREIDDTMNKLIRIRNFMEGVKLNGEKKDFGNQGRRNDYAKNP